MPTALEYMQFSLGVYASSDLNSIDPPTGWTQADWQPDQISGFSAGCYVNGDEMVISFTGTNDAADVANWTIGLGLPMPQIFAAVDYYFACKAAHPGANITFTGHSLGGGLASLMAVYFDKQATVFDEAPFQVAALNPLVTDAVGAYMIAKGYVDGSFADYLLSVGTLALTREANVTHYYVEGEALNYPRYPFDTLVGTEYLFPMGSSTADPVERHSMTLMTAMQYSSAFHDVVKKLPDLVTQLLDDKNLYAADARDETKEDLLRKLLRHQFGISDAIQPDAMLDRFTSDLQKVAQDGGFTLTNTHITNTLVAFAMQFYYENPEAAVAGKYLFTDVYVTGGIRFDRTDVAANLNDAKGWQMYFQNYLNTLTLEEHRIVLQLLPAATDWFIQAGSVSMSATADVSKAFMVGGIGADWMMGGNEADLLLGNEGDDHLGGGKGNDTLIGGQGFDTYVINAGDGYDTVLDSDGLGVIKFGDVEAKGSAGLDSESWLQLRDNVWKDQQNGIIYILLTQDNGSKTLFIGHGGDSVRVEGWTSGELGIELGVGTAPDPLSATTDLTIVGDLQPVDFNPTEAGVQTQADYLGNIIVSGDAAAGREDVLYGSGGNDLIQSLGGNDYVDGRSGDDRIEGGTGQDLLMGGAGNDTVLGGVDSDVVAGAADDDRLYAETEYTIDEAYTLGETQAASGQRGDLLDGGAGDDTLIGKTGNDILLGGMGKDILLGLGGDDTIEGDANIVSADRNWGVTRTVTQEGDITAYGRNYHFYTEATGSDIGDNDVIYGGAGNDWIFAGGGNDFVDGGADDDVVFGGAGNDLILAQGGNDVLIGDNLHPSLDASLHGDDYLSGGEGDDELWGAGGSDYLEGGDGNDLLMGDGENVPAEYEGNDVLDGGAGNDRLFGGGGNDVLAGGVGDDQLVGGDGNDTLVGGDGADTLFGQDGDDSVDGGLGDDQLVGGSGNDSLVGGDGVDTLFGEDGDDRLDGGLGNDYLDGGAGADVMAGGAGDDTYIVDDAGDVVIEAAGEGLDSVISSAAGFVLPDHIEKITLTGTALDATGNAEANTLYGNAEANRLDGMAGNDTLVGGAGDDILLGGSGDDTLLGQDGSDVLEGGEGNDHLQGDAGDDTLDGGDGADSLLGGDGSDRLWGGAGNDELQGNAGDDVYLFELGDGEDVIWEEGDSAGDVLRFGEGIAASDITVSKNGYALVLSHANGVDQVTVANWYLASSYQLARFEFADGTVWGALETGNLGLLNLRGTAGDDAIYGTSINETLVGLDGNDRMFGNGGNDVLAGGKGDDVLMGGEGTDTYIFTLGGGNDVINADYADTLRFGTDIAVADIAVERVGYDLILRHRNGTDSVNIQNWYVHSYYQLQQVVFDLDGTSLSAYTLGTMGTNFENNYALNLGDGSLIIADWGGSDSLTFGAGIEESDIAISRVGQDLYFSHTNGADSVTIKDWFNDVTKQIETIRFSNTGSVLTAAQLTTPFLTLTGTAGNDVIQGGNAYGESLSGLGGNDTLNGGDGADTYYFNQGDGQDTITDTSYGNTLVFGPNLLGLLSMSSSGGDIVYSFGATDSVRVKAGSYVTPKFIANGSAAADTLNGSGYGDVLHGLGGNDTLYGNAGADELYGDAGNDTIVGGAGTDWLYGGDGDDLLDGYSLTAINSNEDINGSDSPDYYVGGRGNDTLNGNSNADTYYFNLGDGNDTIIDAPLFGNNHWIYSTSDQLIFGSGITVESIQASKLNTDMVVQVSATDSVTIKDWFSNPMGWVDSLKFADGRVIYASGLTQLALTVHGTAGDDILYGDGTFGNVIYGEAGNDKLTGGNGADILYGGVGDDELIGRGGNDTLYGDAGNDFLYDDYGNDVYYFQRGGGQDTVVDFSGSDKVYFDSSISAVDISMNRSGNNLVLELVGTNDTLTIQDYMRSSEYIIEDFIFSDGSTLPSTQAIQERFLNIRGSSAGDVLFGSALIDVMYGGDGDDVLSGLGDDDTLYGDAGNDYLDGGDGNDRLNGGAGDDVLAGGTGSDYLAGEDGNDSYVYSSGGVYSISESSGDDKLILPGGISAADLHFGRGADNGLVIYFANGGSVAISHQLLGGAYSVEHLVFADGRVLGMGDVQFSTGTALTGTAEDSILLGYSWGDWGSNDTLSGGDGNDWLEAGLGSDTLNGDNGNDWLLGGEGNDMMTGGNGNDVYFVDNSKDVVTEFTGQGADTVSSSITYTLGANVENLVLSGTERINGTGNTLDNIIIGNSAANTLTGGAGNDWLDGMGGIDKMIGGTGDDTYAVDSSSETVTERSGEGTDVVLSSATYTLASNVENLTLIGTAAINGAGNALYNVLTGNNADNTLSGGAGNDTLDGMGGADILIGGKGNDTYIFGRGYGTDTAVENDTSAGNTDIAQFLSGISADQIWFRRGANDLEVSIIGTADTLVVKDWYLGTAYHIEQFKTADGMTLLDSQVENLVNAMASFTPPAAGETTLPPTYQSSLDPVIAASWQ